MKTAFMFTGQGAQFVGMGRELHDKYPSVREVYARAAALGADVKEVSFNGPPEELSRTANLQPALFVLSAALLGLLGEAGARADAVCGFSLGEISALYGAGMLDFEDTLRLITARGEAMEAAARERSGAMCAVLGPEAAAIEAICASVEGYVICANYNCPGQTVISGEAAAVAEAARKAAETGAKCVPLKVSGAFHSKQMDGARARVAELAGSLNFEAPSAALYSNVTGKRMDFGGAPSFGEYMAEYLPAQLASPVRFEEEIRAMIADGYSEFIEIGAGKTLSGFLRRIDRSVSVRTAEEVISGLI